jgi:adenylyl-sulfate kinase
MPVVWLTGISSAGKSTISEGLCAALRSDGYRVEILDGDYIRSTLSRDLAFTKHDRDENVRRIGCVAEMLARNGIIVIVAVISPYRVARDEVRRNIAPFLEVYVNAPLSVCERRDVKGLYQKARSGELKGLSGFDDPYEPPLKPEVECHTDQETIDQSVGKIAAYLRSRLSATHSGG